MIGGHLYTMQLTLHYTYKVYHLINQILNAKLTRQWTVGGWSSGWRSIAHPSPCPSWEHWRRPAGHVGGQSRDLSRNLLQRIYFWTSLFQTPGSVIFQFLNVRLLDFRLVCFNLLTIIAWFLVFWSVSFHFDFSGAYWFLTAVKFWLMPCALW